MAGLSDGEAGRIRHRTPMSAPGLRLFTEEGPDVSRAVPQRKRDGARDRIEKRTVHSLCPKKARTANVPFKLEFEYILVCLPCVNEQRFVSTPLYKFSQY